MASTDLVPCFYTGQNYRVEKPAKFHTRAEVREFKRQALGKFIDNGKIFLFFKQVCQKAKQLWDGPFGVGNLLPFFKVQNPKMFPEKLHYEIPHAGDTGPLRKNGLRGKKTVEWNTEIAAMTIRQVLVTRTIQVSVRRGKAYLAAATTVPAGVLSVSIASAASPNSAQ